ncbi:MAG: phosphate/phosphite/phosphonate ABC transporter substrate-binding protein [Desulfosarcina sp.]|nr:phosphate/phosphite/phosphonate ABC transporter substrate-binding protein [Desulfobacterales bacterium]
MLWLLVFCAFSVIACSDAADFKTVDFSRRIPVAQPAETPDSRSALRVAVGAMISPQRTFTYYVQLLNYIGRKTDRPVKMIQRKTYGEINTLLGNGRIDLAFICAGPYTSGKDQYGFKALAVPIVRGEPYYQAYLIVHRDSDYQHLDDLRGKVFAFTDPESNTGKLVPTFWLRQIEETPPTFFRRSIYSFSHDNSIMAVAEALVDGAAVHSQVWEYLNRKQPAQTEKTRIIKISQAFGNPPMVASGHLRAVTRERIQAVLLSMHRNTTGRSILDELLIERFTLPEEEWYRPIAKMIETSCGDPL